MELFNGKYEKDSLLGRGAFSEVWRVKDTQTGVVQALKIYSPATAMQDDGIEMMKHEFALMANASHQNLLRPLYFDICNQRPYLILSYCKNGNIKRMVGHFSEQEAWTLLRDAASGLAYLNKMNPPIIHQDIKPENILIADNGSYMLTDFGVSIRVRNAMSKLSNEDRAFQSAGTYPYMPPEKFSNDIMPILASDIWSLGVTVYELLMGDLPFGEEGGLRQKLGADIPEIQGNYSKSLRKILVRCMAKDPWKRPLAEELVKIADEHIKPAKTLRQGTIKKKPSGKTIYAIVALIAVVALAAVCYLFFAYSDSDQQPVPDEPIVAFEQSEQKNDFDTVEVKEEPKVVDEPKEDVKEETEEETAKTDTDSKDQAERTEKAEKKQISVEPKKQAGGNLPYGSWTGSVVKGKPNGIGTLTITVSHTIRCHNNTTIDTQPGDIIRDAEFDSYGNLYLGTWIKANGDTKTITP